MNLESLIILMDVSDVLRLHDMVISRYGGASGIRDKGLLESAVYQPIMMKKRIKKFLILQQHIFIT